MDFNTFVDRKDTSSLKWDKYKNRDILPLWVADMDFVSSPAIINSLRKRIDHGIFGYTLPPQELYELIIARLQEKYQWHIKKEWILFLPNLVTGIHVTCRTIGKQGDTIVNTTPIYPPFLSAPSQSGRRISRVPMVKLNNRWTLDMDRFRDIMKSHPALFLFCSPHNPTGRVFSVNELESIGKLCHDNNVFICSDEIHCDLILDKKINHTPIASISDEMRERTITLMSPSKTYNIAGLGFSFAIIPNKTLRKSFKHFCHGIIPDVTLLGFTAAIAAYKDSENWLARAIEYLRDNRDYVEEAISLIPGLSMSHVEATYLAWIHAEPLAGPNPIDYFEKIGVGLSDGRAFDGNGYVRLNFACPRSILTQALNRIKAAV